VVLATQVCVSGAYDERTHSIERNILYRALGAYWLCVFVYRVNTFYIEHSRNAVCGCFFGLFVCTAFNRAVGRDRDRRAPVGEV
jgi:hypothetical protein